MGLNTFQDSDARFLIQLKVSDTSNIAQDEIGVRPLYRPRWALIGPDGSYCRAYPQPGLFWAVYPKLPKVLD